jgi:predicted Zn-dependent protease
MRSTFRTTAEVALPALAHRPGCACTLHARRRLGGALLGGAALAAWPAGALRAQPQDSVAQECKISGFTKVVSAEQVEQAAGQQYRQMLQQAAGQRALGPKEHPQVQRLRYIAQRIIPYTDSCNPRARDWRWDVNLIGSPELNAFCMPGGRIAFYYGILVKLQLDDDEVAQIMGHEISHALLEHARERMGKTLATRGAIEIGSLLLGLGSAGRGFADMGGQLLSLSFSRSDESEADALGLVLAAKAGYNPRAGVTLWQKMMAASKGAPPQWLSTHPAGDTRIHDIQARLPRVEALYLQAAKAEQRFAPPAVRQGAG